MDLFEFKCNTKLAAYMSPIPEPEAWKVDSLVQSWEGLRLCVPTNGSDQTDSVDLAQSRVDPHSPPLAETGMVSGPPTTVKRFSVGTSTNTKLLKQSFSQHFHQRPRTLNLHAWRLSVDPIKLEDFRNKCPTGSLFLKENPLLTSMNRSGIPLENGVSLMELIHTRLLCP